MVRRFYRGGETNAVADGLEDYPDAVRAVGKELDVPVVDFNAFSRDLIERTPREKSLPWFRAVLNKTDMTHLTKEGAKVMAASHPCDLDGRVLRLKVDSPKKASVAFSFRLAGANVF